jgi:hypothetical protein
MNGLRDGEVGNYVGRDYSIISKPGENGVKPVDTEIKPGEKEIKPGENGVKPSTTVRPCLWQRSP